MPYLSIQTNTLFDTAQTSDFIHKASKLVAEQLGKPERYVMVAMPSPVPMMFAGSDDATVFVELKSIGLSEDQTGDLSKSLCKLISDELSIAADRIYIEFADAPRKMWGWNHSTF